MRWSDRGQSSNVEDQRGAGGGRFGGGGARLGVGGMLVLLVLSVVFKRDFFSLVGAGGGGGPSSGQAAPGPVQSTPEEEKLAHFVGFVLDTTQAFWAQEFPSLGAQYQPARLVLFRDGIESACGVAQTSSGPFYCPGDEKVYIDLGFYDELTRKFGAPGDFAQAYVIAHELGHHVQNLLGLERRMREAQQRHPEQANELSVRLELQADCFAGVWGHGAEQEGILEAGDVEEGLRAAASVGDDRIQKMTQGYVSPEGFTHGTAEQRQRWFNAGFTSGDPKRCDTFGAKSL